MNIMTHNKLILTQISKKLLKTAILNVYNTHEKQYIKIVFKKIHNISYPPLFPKVIEFMITDYVNDELVFDMCAYYKCCVVLRVCNTDVSLYDQSHQINYEINFYGKENIYPNVHFLYDDDMSHDKCMSNILKSDDYIFMNKYLDTYMKTYYNINNYFGDFYDFFTYNLHESTKTTVLNHRVLKHIIIMSRILMNVGVNVFKKMK